VGSGERSEHFMGLGEGVKSRLFQTLIRDAHPDSNSRPAVQTSNPLPSRYAHWDPIISLCKDNFSCPNT